jgi:zona occludens toxin (predicted ATPase)
MAKFRITDEPISVGKADPVPESAKVEEQAAPVIEASPEAPLPPPLPSEKKFRVLADAKVSRGGAHYTLKQGHIVSSLGYDIEALKRSKVQLEEVA